MRELKPTPQERLTLREVDDAYVSSMEKVGRSPKTINNHLNFLHGLFAFAEKRARALGNAVPKRAAAGRWRDPDIRFIDLEEL